MNRSNECLNESRRQRNEVIVARHVHQLFQRLPMLCGFWLRPDLKITELSVLMGYTGMRGLHEHVAEWLVELAQEYPEAVQLMRGRTFARALH